jgi:DNA modification methylase
MVDSGHPVGDAIYKTVCPICGAIRVDDQIGLEESPEEYIERLVAVFHELHRVLKDDGTLWLNIGDSYNGSGGNHKSTHKNDSGFQGVVGERCGGRGNRLCSCKPKDLIGIPWMLAFALRSDGWYLRQDIIWHKPNPMPESVKDRCTKSHEYIFLLTKSPDYYFNYESIQEEAVTDEHRPSGVERERTLLYNSKRNNNPEAYLSKYPKFGGNKYGDNDDSKFAIYSGNEWKPTVTNGKIMRNKRDVWTIKPSTFKGSHFATFPEELVMNCILAGSKAGDTIIDPFSGSGTTGVVALKSQRNYIGIELNQEYVDMSEKRLKPLLNRLF